jgi:hypothetical protein
MTDTDRSTGTAAVTQLSDGAAGTVLSLEFLGSADGPGPATALAGRSTDVAVWRADPIFAAARPDAGIDALVAAFVARAHEMLPADRRLTVVGHCTAARLTELVAAGLESSHVRVTSVLVAPFYPDGGTLREEFTQLRRQLNAVPDPETAPGDVEAMSAVLSDDLRARTAELGLEADEAALVVGQLLRRYVSWLALLAGLAGSRPPVLSGPRHVLVGDDHPGGGARVTRFPGRGRHDLPADVEVAEYVLRLARSGGAER